MDELVAKAAELAGCTIHEVQWYSWPQVFGTTSGPRGGVGGRMMTTFQVFAFECADKRMKYCAGVWRHWDGEFMGRW